MNPLILLLFITSSPSAHAAELPSPKVPSSEAFIGWSEQPYNVDKIDFSKLNTKKWVCKDKMLQPLSKDQSTKKYHKFLIGEYNLSKLRGDSEACLLASKTTIQCSRADTVQYTIMSDVYRDNCGNKFRAFWEVLFLSGNESMGTLCSLGRTFYEKANSEFPGEVEIGPTYPVEASKFLFFADLFESDVKL